MSSPSNDLPQIVIKDSITEGAGNPQKWKSSYKTLKLH